LRIWTLPAEGGDATPLGRGYAARWSPDGKRLVVATPTAESEGDLFVMNADGTGRHRLLATPELEQAADWSPDGTMILFTQLNTSGADVMVMDADGTNVRNLIEPRGFDFAAVRSPEGGTILFTTGGTPPVSSS
jgi:Tol biopolymer transport system component